jgi:chromosome segregation protein
VNFQVPGQLVGVVGPNGCGKSNIIDAVRWVLGESKASELRGESMQDVIFNGSTHRKPAGRASVELTFDNSAGKAAGQWGQYTDIAVKRTLTRDGTSTYYINNQAVRRRDIQDIFLGTGLGPRAYAIIGQGMIARIIEARPEELRIFLEEAAGVSKYKERRRETENRLHDTRENLVRLDDILRELNANLEKLQGQAAIAQQFHALQAEHDEKQQLLWLLRKNEAQAEQQKCSREIDSAQTELEQQTAGLRHSETVLEHTRQAHYAASDSLYASQNALYQTNTEIGSLEAQIRFVIESRNRLQAQLDTLTRQHDQWHAQSLQNKDDLMEAELHLEECSARVEQAQETEQQYHDRLPVLEQSWREAQQRIAQSHNNIMQARQQIELEAAHQRNATAILSNLTVRRERLLQEKNGLNLPDNTHFSHLNMQLEENRAVLEEAQYELDEAQEQQPILEQECRAMQAEVNTETSRTTQLEAHLLALKQLQDNVQTKTKVQPWLDKHGLGELPRLWQKLHIESGWETALESVLRECTAALEIVDLDWAKAFFNDVPPAKLVFFTGKSVFHTVAGGSAGLRPFWDLLQFNDPGLRSVMQDWLHHVFVAEDTATAFVDRTRLPDGACFVTRQGHVIGRTSVRFYAADSEQDGMLARQQKIDHLGKQSRAQHLINEEARVQLVRNETALSQVMQRLQDRRQRVATLTQTVHALQIELMKLSEVQARFHQRSTHIVADLAEIAEQDAEQHAVKSESEARFEQFDIALGTLQELHEEEQTAYLAKEQQLDDARQSLRELERRAQEAEFAEKSQHHKIDELTRRIATAHEQLAQLSGQIQAAQQELTGLKDQAASAGLQSLLDKRMAQEQVLKDARGELDQLAQQLRQHEETRLQGERNLQPQRDRIMELQLKEQAARLNHEQYAQQLADTQADVAMLHTKLDSTMRPSWLQGELTRLTNAIAVLGAVNLAALDELAQASARKNYLDAQNADLNEAMNTLQDAIHKIDIETRDLLQDTFDKVNAHFGELFPILFGGGNAKLIMTGDEILHAGVQVMAQPPGKKNATIHLLSGGEKALTATALVFSMFQLNPAPFCLLDEVDAPLDDANTERFCKMVKRMSSHTQFLFISHNKIAMEMANQLIGVTMQEQGVSRIVAVDI